MRLLNANANEHPLRIKLSAHIRTEIIMESQRNKVCGIDVHKRFLIATILSRDGKKDTQRFSVTLEDLLKFRDWVIDGCEQVAMNRWNLLASCTLYSREESFDCGEFLQD
jgi:hypothetical protein